MKFWKTMMLAAVTLFVTGTVIPAIADDGQKVDSYAEKITRKLGRGIVNVGFGALEIPLKMYEVNFEEGGLAACTYGVLFGVYNFVKREIVGVIDIATFPIPLPGCMPDEREAGWGYGPIMRPEWIITPEKNVYNVVYPNSATLN